METSQEYNDTYNGLNDSEKYKSYINSIENLKKYIEKKDYDQLKTMLVNASMNQGIFKSKILALLDKKIEAMHDEIERERKTVGSIYRIDEDAEYGGKRRRNKKVQKRTKKNCKSKSNTRRRAGKRSCRK
jgi:hypothetical protein